jgi:hypothetical protein
MVSGSQLPELRDRIESTRSRIELSSKEYALIEKESLKMLLRCIHKKPHLLRRVLVREIARGLLEIALFEDRTTNGETGR